MYNYDNLDLWSGNNMDFGLIIHHVRLNWRRHVKFISMVFGLTFVATLIISVFPSLRDVVFLILGMIAARLDIAAKEKSKPIFKHLKRGTTYNVLGVARIQTEWPVVDNVELTVYQSTEDGKMWARPTDEFEDGRFVKLEG